MENLEIILSVAGTALGFLITTITFLTRFIKSAKAQRVAENLTAIGNAVIPYIEEAEKFAGYSGKEKKEYVMTKANQFAIDKGISFDAAAVSAKIEELIQLTNDVNAKTRATSPNVEGY